MTLTAAEILIEQEPVSGVSVKVSIPSVVNFDLVTLEFNDMKTGNQVLTIDQHIVDASAGWTIDGSNNVRSFTMESAAYLEAILNQKLATGALIQVQVRVQVANGPLVFKNQPDLPYYQPLTFAIDTVTTSFNSLIVNLHDINELVYAQNTGNDGFDAVVTLTRTSDGKFAMGNQYNITKNSAGTATIVMNDLSGSGLDPVHDSYEIKVIVKNKMIPAGFSVSKDISITNKPGTVESVNFKTFDLSGAKFTLEYQASKDYTGYEKVNVYARFGDASTTRYQVGALDISGAQFAYNRPTIYILPDEVKALLPKYKESDGSNSTKFTATFWIEAQESANSVLLKGHETASKYWLDTQLVAPDVTLQSVNFDNGEQFIYVVADGSFNDVLKPRVVYDLSNVGTHIAVNMTISGEVLAHNTQEYTYEQLVTANGGPLNVTVSRREVNNPTGSYTNIAPVKTLDYLSPIKRAVAPTASFTITDGPDSTNGTVEVVFVNSIDLCGNTTSLLATLNQDGSEINDVSGAIATDASNTQFDFGDIVSGITYTAKAYSRFDISSLADRYEEINGSIYLLSVVKQDATLFTTSPPTMTMYVLPTGTTNALTTVRMDGEAKANKIEKLQVYALQDGGKVATQQLDISSAGTATTGGDVLRSAYDANDLSYNAGFSQDFLFNKVIDVAADGKMFVLGIIDTPDQTDAIQVDISATVPLSNLRIAINTYNADIIAYEDAYDLSANPNGDTLYRDASAAYIAWDASMEDLSGDLVGVTNVIDGSASVLGSLAHLNAAITDNSGALLTLQAAAATRVAAGAAFTAWTDQYAAANANTDPTATAMLSGDFTYVKTTVSGEQLVTSDFDASAVSQSNVGVLLTATITALTNANNAVGTNDEDGTSDALLASETAYNDAIVIKQGLGGETGSVAHALDQRDNQESIRDNRYAALLLDIIAARVKLVGKDGDEEGDVQAPEDGSSIKAMNDARTALGAFVKGVIAAFAVPALKGTLVPPV